MATAATALIAIALPALGPAPMLNADNYCIQIPKPILSMIAVCTPSIAWFNDTEYVMCMMRKREFTDDR